MFVRMQGESLPLHPASVWPPALWQLYCVEKAKPSNVVGNATNPHWKDLPPALLANWRSGNSEKWNQPLFCRLYALVASNILVSIWMQRRGKTAGWHFRLIGEWNRSTLLVLQSHQLGTTVDATECVPCQCTTAKVQWLIWSVGCNTMHVDYVHYQQIRSPPHSQQQFIEQLQ